MVSIYTCLEFELLEQSLYDMMAERHFEPLDLRTIRPIIRQVASALDHLKSVDIIHADLKLENVMLVGKSEPFKVKVIDFGLAREVQAVFPGLCVQTLAYRAPEVLLGANYDTAIDVWSLGCMAAFLYLGTYLYFGCNPYEMLWHIEQLQGALPEHLVHCGLFSNQFYKNYQDCPSASWKLLSPDEYFSSCKIPMKKLWRQPLYSLDDFLDVRSTDSSETADMTSEKRDVCQFVDLLKGLLTLDPPQRITSCTVLQHPFTATSHVQSEDRPCQRVKLCREGTAPFCKLDLLASAVVHCSNLGSSNAQTGAAHGEAEKKPKTMYSPSPQWRKVEQQRTEIVCNGPCASQDASEQKKRKRSEMERSRSRSPGDQRTISPSDKFPPAGDAVSQHSPEKKKRTWQQMDGHPSVLVTTRTEHTHLQPAAPPHIDQEQQEEYGSRVEGHQLSQRQKTEESSHSSTGDHNYHSERLPELVSLKKKRNRTHKPYFRSNCVKTLRKQRDLAVHKRTLTV